jgi:hypothetical protein
MKAMKKFASAAIIVLALLLAAAVPSEARGHGGHGGGHGGFSGHQGGHFEGHRDFRGHAFIGGAPFFWGPAYPYWWDTYGYSYPPPPTYAVPSQQYWYYCPSAGGYYPNVPNCPEQWVTVPAQ